MTALSNVKRRAATLFALTAMAALMAMPAFAQETGVSSVNDAISDAASDASGIVTTGIPVVLGVAVLWVALKFGKRLLNRI